MDGGVATSSAPQTRKLPAPELCVVVPVLNERDNVAPLVAKLDKTLAGIDWEVVFVDDGSTDGTRDAVAAIGRADSRVRLLHRVGRRGLASAFIEGVRCSLAPYVAAMDGDLQHDERILPDMLRALRANEADVVIGSRYVAGGGLGEWDKTRAGMSDMATRLSRLVLRVPVTDPMSGFFMLPRTVFERAAPRLSAIGFKILLDLLASLPETAAGARAALHVPHPGRRREQARRRRAVRFRPAPARQARRQLDPGPLRHVRGDRRARPARPSGRAQARPHGRDRLQRRAGGRDRLSPSSATSCSTTRSPSATAG